MFWGHVAEDTPKLCLARSTYFPEALLFLVLFLLEFVFTQSYMTQARGVGKWQVFFFLKMFQIDSNENSVCVRERRERDRQTDRPVDQNYRIEG